MASWRWLWEPALRRLSCLASYGGEAANDAHQNLYLISHLNRVKPEPRSNTAQAAR